MGLDPEDRASARSDEPEARSAARWRVRATGDPPDAAGAALGARWPAVGSCPLALRWLALQSDLGRSPRTLEAYGRALADYLVFCERRGLDVVAVGRGEIAAYVRDLRERPGRRGANVVAIDSGAGLANATLQLRITVVRLFYDFLVEERVCDRNPVGRGRRSLGAGHSGERGLIARYSRLPWIPTDEQWRALLAVAAGESLRNRLMLALAYDAGLRREELCLRAADDLNPAHRTLRVRRRRRRPVAAASFRTRRSPANC